MSQLSRLSLSQEKKKQNYRPFRCLLGVGLIALALTLSLGLGLVVSGPWLMARGVRNGDDWTAWLLALDRGTRGRSISLAVHSVECAGMKFFGQSTFENGNYHRAILPKQSIMKDFTMEKNELLQAQLCSIKAQAADIENSLTFLGQIFDAASNQAGGRAMICGEDGEGLRGLSAIIFGIREAAYQVRLRAVEMTDDMGC